MNDLAHIRMRELIDRLSRIIASQEWSGDINPTQWTALSYLEQANRFSRSPSQVADFMSATRGTVSQTLKALARKGLIKEVRIDADRRSFSYCVTQKGREFLNKRREEENAIIIMDNVESSRLADSLESIIRNALKERQLRPFGVCKTCIHNQITAEGGFCNLLGENLSHKEVTQICHEHSG